MSDPAPQKKKPVGPKGTIQNVAAAAPSLTAKGSTAAGKAGQAVAPAKAASAAKAASVASAAPKADVAKKAATAPASAQAAVAPKPVEVKTSVAKPVATKPSGAKPVAAKTIAAKLPAAGAMAAKVVRAGPGLPGDAGVVKAPDVTSDPSSVATPEVTPVVTTAAALSSATSAAAWAPVALPPDLVVPPGMTAAAALALGKLSAKPKMDLRAMRPAALRNVQTSAVAAAQSRFAPVVQPTMHPRKVRGGVKLLSKEGPASTSWAGQRWMRLVEDCAPGESLAEGMLYARLGQIKYMQIAPGHISAKVQGRLPFAYAVDIRLPTFTFEQWEAVIGAMVAEARPLASLLSGEVPQNIEDLFSPLRLALFPAEPSHLSLSCSCHRSQPAARPMGGYQGNAGGFAGPTAADAGEQALGGEESAELPSEQHTEQHAEPATEDGAEQATESVEQQAGDGVDRVGGAESVEEMGSSMVVVSNGQSAGSAVPPAVVTPWCKHVCCVMALIAERLGQDTFVIMQLRGVGKEDLLERLRQRRAVAGSGRALAAAGPTGPVDRPIPAYTPQIAGISDCIGNSLEQTIESFWDIGPELGEIELPLERPQVTHPLLRRLGPTPFVGARFPLVGLLATCYELIGEKMLPVADAPMLGDGLMINE